MSNYSSKAFCFPQKNWKCYRNHRNSWEAKQSGKSKGMY